MSEIEDFDMDDAERDYLDEGMDEYDDEESWIDETEGESQAFESELGGESFPLTDEEIFLRDVRGEFHYVNYYQHAPKPT